MRGSVRVNDEPSVIEELTRLHEAGGLRTRPTPLESLVTKDESDVAVPESDDAETDDTFRQGRVAVYVTYEVEGYVSMGAFTLDEALATVERVGTNMPCPANTTMISRNVSIAATDESVMNATRAWADGAFAGVVTPVESLVAEEG